MERYGKITSKQKREIVLLRGRGCAYKKCAFCDYHLDKCESDELNFNLNREVLNKVTGEFGNLEVINSGSVFELDGNTLNYIKEICKNKNIKILHFESHYMYREKIPALRREFTNITLKMKIGLETFDYDFREKVMLKGIHERDPEAISRNFDEANFLFGISGQSAESMERDITLGLKLFERICVNIMCVNSTSVAPDKKVIEEFKSKLYPEYADNERIDILINNTDFGVGE